MTSSSTGQKVIVGTGFAANISYRDASLNGRRSSSWSEIRVIVFVSLYLQLTRRDPNALVKLRQKSVSEMLRDEKFGCAPLLML